MFTTNHPHGYEQLWFVLSLKPPESSRKMTRLRKPPLVMSLLLMYMTSEVACVYVTSSYKIQKLRGMEEEYLALLKK
jgi:hypothetical protein